MTGSDVQGTGAAENDGAAERSDPVRVVSLDLDDPLHRLALVTLLDEYASGAEGGGTPLPAAVKQALPAMLAGRPNYLGFLALAGTRPAGLANCFEGVSTFRAAPLINVHDLIVSAPFRRRGVGTALLAAVEAAARSRGCCKITLEVLEGNARAIAAYRKAGFAGYQLDPQLGRAVFLEKKFY